MAEIKTITINGRSYTIPVGTPIYSELGISIERLAELLSRDAYTPVLDSEPTGETSVYTDTDGSENHFRIGQAAVWPDAESDTGWGISFLLAVREDGTRVWGSGGGGGSVDLTETVTVALSSNLSGSDASINGARILVEGTSGEQTETLLDTAWEGSPVTFKVPAMTAYRITFGSVEGYRTPASVRNTAQIAYQRTVNAVYDSCAVGVSISGLENGATAKATVSYGGKLFTAGSGQTVKVPMGTEVTVSAPAVDCHAGPQSMTFTPDTASRQVTLVYTASKLKVSVLSNQTDDGTISATAASVTWSGGSATATDGQTLYIPADRTVTVTFPAVTGYRTPSAVTVNNTSGGTATASGTYQTEVVTVTVNAEDSSSVAGQKVTVNGTVFTLGSTGKCTSKVPFGTSYSVSADAKSGYTSPATQTFTASQASRAVSMTYETIKLGVFIQDKSGKLWTTNQWSTANNANANAIAVLTENVKVLVALTDSGGTKRIHSSYSGALENYMTAISNETQAKADYKGKENTANIMKLQSSTSYAAGWANAFTFPDGTTKGHLPSLGEFWEVYQNKAAVDAALSKCGGTAMNTSYYHWCSTFWGVSGSNRRCWLLDWIDGDVSYSHLNNSYYVRPFAAYSN